jgi:hypothetical protein
MAFQAKLPDGKVVWPDEVTKQQDIFCLECDDPMHVVKGHVRIDDAIVPRHFKHSPGARAGGHCNGGESNPHLLMKYVASRALSTVFEHGEVKREVSMPAISRQADVVLEFEDGLFPYGRGIVAECQYKNKDKDYQANTRDYLQEGYSVYWLQEKHFGNDFGDVTFPDLVHAWPNAVPMPSYWRPHETAWEDLGETRSSPSVPVVFPQDLLESMRSELERIVKIWDDTWDWDLVIELAETNAPRSCGECGRDADYHLWKDGILGTFRCSDHIPNKEELTKKKMKA